ncbi:MAG: 3D domain-containing protein [Kiritimatiellae bacterium]|nr:3D domain-containing protein [Kiritimatiellia bacterium]
MAPLPPAPRSRFWGWLRTWPSLVLTVAAGLVVLGGCALLWHEPDDGEIRGRYVTIVTTAYCPCEKCCHWKLDGAGRPVHSKGRMQGKPKVVGQTAAGTMAHPGTIAADTRYYPMGTLIYVPGYGYGVVEDRGGDIKGRHRLDLFMTTHEEAMRWGRQKLSVVVFPKGAPRMRKDGPPPIP